MGGRLGPGLEVRAPSVNSSLNESNLDPPLLACPPLTPRNSTHLPAGRRC